MRLAGGLAQGAGADDRRGCLPSGSHGAAVAAPPDARPDGSVLDDGRATRTISAALFMVLCLRDRGCRFPGCNRPCHLTDAHHIQHWIDHGHTEPDNLALLCRHHHGVIHRPGWEIGSNPTPP